MIEIKQAARDELYDIAVFLNECWRMEYRKIIVDDYLDSMTVQERHEGLLDRFDGKFSDFLFMYDDDKLVGAAVFGKSYTDDYLNDGEISAIYLHNDWIGKGYGHLFFTKIEEALSAKGYAHFVLDVLTGNTRAIAFYLKHGYKKVDDRSIKLGEQDYSLTVFRKKNPLSKRF